METFKMMKQNKYQNTREDNVMEKKNIYKSVLSKVGMVLIALLMVSVASLGKTTEVKAQSQAETIVNYALSQVGVKERSNNSDDVIYNDWYYGRRVINSRKAEFAWCHTYVSYCANKCGISTNVIPKTASCQAGVNWFKNKGRYYTRKSGYQPKAGDIIYLSTDGTSVPHHVGIVYDVDSSKVYFVDGNNTTMTPHGVRKSSRYKTSSDVLGYGSPNYSGSSDITNISVAAKPSIDNVSISQITSTKMVFSFSVNDATKLARIVVINKTNNQEAKYDYYPTKATRYTTTVGFPVNAGNKYYVRIYGYAKQNGQYVNETLHAMTYGPTIGSVELPVAATQQSAKPLTDAELKELCFDYKYYADKYPDLKAAFGYNEAALYNHWLTYGIKEGRTSSIIWNPVKYLALNPDIKKAYGNDYKKALEHFRTYGSNEFRGISDYYDASYYKAKYKSEMGNFTARELLFHFRRYGFKEQRWGSNARFIGNSSWK